MKIKVYLYTILREYGIGKIGEDGSVLLSERKTLKGLCDFLNIPEKLGKVFLVNGRPCDETCILEEGDEVKILSFIGGG